MPSDKRGKINAIGTLAQPSRGTSPTVTEGSGLRSSRALPLDGRASAPLSAPTASLTQKSHSESRPTRYREVALTSLPEKQD
jgi:hypothetical protein